MKEKKSHYKCNNVFYYLYTLVTYKFIVQIVRRSKNIVVAVAAACIDL